MYYIHCEPVYGAVYNYHLDDAGTLSVVKMEQLHISQPYPVRVTLKDAGFELGTTIVAR